MLSDQQRDYLTKIDASAKSLLGVVNDILDFSQIEANEFTIEHEEFQLATWLGDDVARPCTPGGEREES